MSLRSPLIWPYCHTFDFADIVQLRPDLLAGVFDHLRWAEPVQFDILHQAMWSSKARFDAEA